MPLLNISNLSKSFGQNDIFSGVTLSVPYRARMAIVGPNGIGKTTLLRILAGEDTPTQGQISQMRGLKIGYLPQEATFVDSSHTLWEECLESFANLLDMEQELAHLEGVMGDPDQAEATLDRYGKVQVEFDHLGGYTYINRIEQVLTGLGFSPDEFEYPLGHLSGGQRTRALLARLLLSNPDILILDEPTNHLDIQAVEWLEGYLSQWEGATLLVSHDRYFLDKVASIILEMTRYGFEVYRGNYTAYLQQRQERWDERLRIFEAEREQLERDLEYIRRNISGQNSPQARGRLRRLSRRLQAIDQLGMQTVVGKNWGEISESVQTTVSMMSVDEATQIVHGLRPPTNRPPILHLKLKAEARSGEIVLRAHDLQIGYPNKVLFRADEIELRRLECAALIGPNGAGKTTFLKTILEKLPPLAGEVTLGASLTVGYFAQAHEELHPERTLVQEIDSVAPEMLVADIRNYLARFLFYGEDVYKSVSVLSGGERGRLALAKLALSNANLLLLDEPTNHLDIPSQEILQDVLAGYKGTILLVSHDRYLIDALATQVWEIDESAGKLTVFNGTYSEYHAFQEAEREAQRISAEAQRSMGNPGKPIRSLTQDESLSKRRPSNEDRRRLKRLQDLEASITNLEAELKVISHKLENPPPDPLKVQRLGVDYMRVQNELDQLLADWEKLHSE